MSSVVLDASSAASPDVDLLATPRARAFAMLAAGGTLGFVISSIGFGDYEQLFLMMTFGDLRMFLAFAGAVAISVAGYRLLRSSRPLPTRTFHRGIVTGGVAFGLGWAVCGACPGIAFAQLGQGKLWAAVTLLGITFGTLAHQRLSGRARAATPSS